ncbi:hypothetical protein EUX98_g247 [Antrodiella citrinella]|uniref:Protein transport protein sec16 n=1 Tax=Antrodiella citrinella TaxID=2447956 RepID=A0A4S4N7H9_9APHY|nr:hypothetical protein EUX98_g247 [Antrodiella citrinella]
MNTAGEAAALFGGPLDSANDPFATSFEAETTSASAELPTGGDPFSAQESSSAADLFASSKEPNLFASVDQTAGNEYGAYADTSAGYGHSYDAYGGHPNGAEDRYTQESYAPAPTQYGTQNGYSQHQGGTAYGTYSNATNASTNYAYDAYATYGTNSQHSYDSTTAQQPTSYSPYTPPTAVLHTAVPEVNAAQVYDPYKPAAVPVQQIQTTYAVPDYSQVRSPPLQSIPPVLSAMSGFSADVPPPLPSASAYRPKTSNAYDPPLPPPKPKRAAQHAWQPQTTSLTPTPYAGGPASRILSPPLPPPPPRGSTPIRHAAHAHAPPPSSSPLQSNHYAQPPSSQAHYNAGASYIPPAVNACPAPPTVPAQSTYAPPPAMDHAHAYPQDNYTNGYTDDDGLGLYNRPSSPQKSVVSHSEPYDPNVNSGFSKYGFTEVSHNDFGSYGDELAGGAGYSSPLDTAKAPSPPLAPSSRDGRSKPASPAPFDLTKSPTQVRQKVLSRHQSPDRTKSPGASSIRSIGSIGSGSVSRRSIDQPMKRSSVNAYSPPVPSYEPPSANTFHSETHTYTPATATNIPRTHSPAAHSYVPATTTVMPRTASPAAFASRSPPLGREVPAVDAYSPANGVAAFSSFRDRSMSSSSSLSISSAASRDLYAPSAPSRQQSLDAYKYSSPPQPFHAPVENVFGSQPSTHPYGGSGVQTLSVAARLTQAPYAPSPSLLGSNDPLGRTSVKIPVVSFGFGGKLVTCFHGASNITAGFDVAMSSRQSTDIHIHTIHKLVPQSALDESSASYPGPLFSDPGSPTASLVRTATAAHTKTKKARVIKYLDDRAEELSRGLGYLHRDSMEGKRAEAKHTLLLLLKVMIENDGKVSGSAQIDAAVRQVLVPHIANQDAGVAVSLHDAPISVNTLRTAHLDNIQDLLIRGERRLAFQYAADEKLWAHAMVIASSIDRDSWKDVVKEFVQTELSSNAASSDVNSAALKGREPLRVAYSLFAGQGAESVQQLAQQKLLIDHATGLQVLAPHASVTPLSPNFPHSNSGSAIPQEVLSKWSQTAAMIFSNPMTTEASSALTALGDQLSTNNWIEAAHVCYLLSPQTSLIGGVSNSTSRIVLVGGPNPAMIPNFWKDTDPIILSEITEFALSLAYRLIRATYLAEVGYVQAAHRDRLIAAPQLDKTGSWIGTKMTRPSLDKLGNWLEGRLTSFIAGEGDTAAHENVRDQDRSFAGPFAHYAQISSATSSTIPTPQRSTTDLTEVPHTSTPPYRSGSAMALRPAASSHAPINRASSAMDYIRRKESPVPRVSSASATTASFTDRPRQSTGNGYSYLTDATPKPHQGSQERLAASEEVEEPSSATTSTGPQIASWWNDASESGAPTPTGTNFVQADAPLLRSTDGFISIMDNDAFAVTPTPTPSSHPMQSHRNGFDEDDEDELGLGNSRSKAMERSESSSSAQSAASENNPSDQTSALDKPAEVKQTASSGWLSRLWKRSETIPGPVKANLGEQTSFYYDKELKRWVNKNSDTESDKPVAHPPPPRAQTASPGTATARQPTGPPMARTPPVRPSTAIDLTDSPPKQPSMRVRSNLVPQEAQSASPNPAPVRPVSAMDGPPGLDGPPPPGARLKAQAKRNVRNRYVDVFQQQGA